MSDEHTGEIYKCGFYGCNNPIAEGEEVIKQGMRLCKEHAEEFDRYVDTDDLRGALKFFIQAMGWNRQHV